MKRVLFFLLILYVITPAILRAEESPEKLIKLLSSDDFEEREKAQRELLKLGKQVRDKITAALKEPNLDADLATRLRLINEKIGQSDILRAYDSPKKISLELKGAKVSAALAKLKEEFGFEINAEGAGVDRLIDLSLKDLTFFEALDAVRAKSGMTYSIRNRGDEGDPKSLHVELKEKAEKAPVMPGGASGPLLLFLENITFNVQRQISANVEEPRETRTLQANGYLVTDPALSFSGLEAGEMELKDAAGAAVQANFQVDADRWRENRGAGQVYRVWINSQVNKDLKGPLSLKLGPSLEVPLRMGEKKIEDLAAAKGKQIDFAGGSVTVNKVEQKNNSWELTVTGVGLGMELLNDAGGFHSGLIRRARGARFVKAAGGGASAGKLPENATGFFILDAQGNPIERNGYSGSGNGQQYEVTVTLSAEPKSILMKWVEEKADRKASIQLKDIPLP